MKTGQATDTIASSGAAMAKQLANNFLRSFDENAKEKPKSLLRVSAPHWRTLQLSILRPKKSKP